MMEKSCGTCDNFSNTETTRFCKLGIERQHKCLECDGLRKLWKPMQEPGITKHRGKYEQVAQQLGALVDQKQAAYGDSFSKTGFLLRIFLSKYKQPDGSYLLPDKLIDHIAVQVRIIDKQNRIFSNPEGDLMGESPYGDICGYGLLGKVNNL